MQEKHEKIPKRKRNARKSFYITLCVGKKRESVAFCLRFSCVSLAFLLHFAGVSLAFRWRFAGVSLGAKSADSIADSNADPTRINMWVQAFRVR